MNGKLQKVIFSARMIVIYQAAHLLANLAHVLNNILTVVVLFVGVLMVFDGSLSAGVLIGVNMLIGKIFRPAQSLVEFPGRNEKTLATTG